MQCGGWGASTADAQIMAPIPTDLELESELARYRAEHPEIGVKALLARLNLEHADWSRVDTKRVREALRVVTSRQNAALHSQLPRCIGLDDVTDWGAIGHWALESSALESSAPALESSAPVGNSRARVHASARVRDWWARLCYCDKETLKRTVAASGRVLGIDVTPEEVERYFPAAEHTRLYAQVDAAPPLVQPRAAPPRPAASSASVPAGNVLY